MSLDIKESTSHIEILYEFNINTIVIQCGINTIDS